MCIECLSSWKKCQWPPYSLFNKSQHYHSQQLREAILTRSKNWIQWMHFLINCHPILFKKQNALQNYHLQMLRKFFKLSINGSSAIQDFVKFEIDKLIRIGLIYYWIFSTSVTNDFCSLGRPRLFWGQKLMIQKNCFILIERYKPFQNFGKK